VELAELHYGNRLRKDGIPVLVHGRRVVEILQEFAGVTDDNVLAVALLHDVLEDTGATKEELEAALGPRITGMIELLTEDHSLAKPERKAKLLKGFPSLPDEAKLVKLADRLDNIRGSWIRTSDIQERYIKECTEMLKAAKGLCPELESALLKELTHLQEND
jgi:(p)ppGpp synthase/HD superfamily hydrolase